MEVQLKAGLFSISLPLFFFCPFCVFQVYVSYDYGKSFNKISEKLNFGPGNSSEAVISQFYHSPADNKRVRRLWLQHTVHSGKMAIPKGAGPRSLSPSLQRMWVTSYIFSLSNVGVGDRMQFSRWIFA